MKLTNLKKNNFNDFFDVIAKCKGNVYLNSSDMNINLKSNLAKYISFTKLCLASVEEINKIDITFQDREDIDMVLDFFANKK